MDIKCAHTELIDIDLLIPNPKNPNKHPENQIKLLAKIMKHQGWRSPIVVSKRSGFIVKGHGRLQAARLNKWTQAPIDRQDYANEADEYADMVADNKIAELSETDLIMVNDGALELPDDFDLELLGIPDFELIDTEELEPGCDEDAIPEHVEPKTKLGDIYTLGNHRLMCGDSTSIDAVEKLMDGNYCDITFTSPPYNAAKNGHLTGNVSGFDKKYQQHSDELSDDDYLGLLAEFTSIAIAKSKYCFVNIQLLTHNRGPLFKYQEQFQSLIKDILIWNKKQCPPNIVKGAFNTKWEYIFCFSEDKKTRGFPCSWQGQFPNVVETESNAANEFADMHKAGFPVALPSWFIEKFDFAKTIYDPFGGTGTTMIAAEKTNRKCFMMELDPHYCDVIVARWEKYTGKKAELLNV